MMKDHTILIIEAGMPQSANVRYDLQFDLALGQIKTGPPFGQSRCITHPTFNTTQLAAYCRAAIDASNRSLV